QSRAQRFSVENIGRVQAWSNHAFVQASSGKDLQPCRFFRGPGCDDSLRSDFARQSRACGFLNQTRHSYLVVSMNVTLLISFIVVTPALTRPRAESRRNFIPSSCAALRISDDGLFSRISSRMRSERSSSS